MAPQIQEPIEKVGRETTRPAASTYTTNVITPDTTPSTPSSQAQPVRLQYSQNRSPYLRACDEGTEYDLVCVGFGPASLAVAVAIHDALAAGKKLKPDGSAPKVLFVEKQNGFAWHAGMLLPGAKMQISFVKDLATLRDPRSEFTFLNYLHKNDRLVDFTNLSTFLPARVEYEDYLRWSASFFGDVVKYNHQVTSVSPAGSATKGVKFFTVQALNLGTNKTSTFRGRNVLFATGGQPSIPRNFPSKHQRVIHSSQYAKAVPQLLREREAPYNVAVIGAGQSAAEIFNNVKNLYPNSKVWLVMRQEFLRPSDDSPFVNSVFNPEYIDMMFPRSARHRNNLLTEARATNYGVVRLELIEELYEHLYHQRRVLGPDDTKWPHRIMGGRQINSVEPVNHDQIELRVQKLQDVSPEGSFNGEEVMKADLIIAATGYQRQAHVDMLKGAWDLLPKSAPIRNGETYGKGVSGWNVDTVEGERKIAVGRDYKVQFAPGAVDDNSGIWLQGCCEGTHGVSSTLLALRDARYRT